MFFEKKIKFPSNEFKVNYCEFVIGTLSLWIGIQYFKLARYFGFYSYNVINRKYKLWNKIVYSYELATMLSEPSNTKFTIKNGSLYIYQTNIRDNINNESMLILHSCSKSFRDLYVKPSYLTDKIDSGIIKTNYKFISVEYFHDKLQEPITLNFPLELYFVNNIILTPIFVLWCLYNQPNHYIFDGNYELRIIDPDTNIIQITNKQKIFLEETEYKVLYV